MSSWKQLTVVSRKTQTQATARQNYYILFTKVRRKYPTMPSANQEKKQLSSHMGMQNDAATSKSIQVFAKFNEESL